MFRLNPFKNISKSTYKIFAEGKISAVGPYTHGLPGGISSTRSNKNVEEFQYLEFQYML